MEASIKYLSGDATKPVGDGPKILVHCCNSIGAWGSGFVLAISRRWKEPERMFRQWHKSKNAFSLGNVQFVRVEDDILVANLIGQKGIKPSGGVAPIRYGAIRRGLQKVAKKALTDGATVHMPKMGACRAGGHWPTIEALVKECLVDAGISVFVYDYCPRR